MIAFRSAGKFDKEATVILFEKSQLERKDFKFKNKTLESSISSLSKSQKFSAENGEIFPLVLQNNLVLLVGLGKKESITSTSIRIGLRKALLSSFLTKIQDVEITPHDESAEVIKALIEAVILGTYSWKKYLSKDKDSKIVDQKRIWLAVAPNSITAKTVAICQGVNFARDLINENADVADSAFLEKNIREIIKGKKNTFITILNRRELKAKGLNLHLAVNQGSRKEPKLVIVKYSGGQKSEKYTALIGKGITFDTGGLNLKPTGYMETMRTDMSGAAAVIGTLKNTLALGLKRNILFVVGIAENVIGSGAFKPGDVFRGYNGKTVEIGNTDAEGRLVLADAIAYTVKNYKPEAIIDIATLTGACVVALGHDYSGLMSNNDALAESLLYSAGATDDRAWRLPIYPEIKDHVRSLVADIKNTSTIKGAAGACTAGEFLRQFTDDTKWAHLDIAGTAFCDGAGRMYYGHGATGAGVRLLTDFLSKKK